jgi:hypothetical protein
MQADAHCFVGAADGRADASLSAAEHGLRGSW